MEAVLTASWSSGDHGYVLFRPFMLFSAFSIMVVMNLSNLFSSVSSCHVSFLLEAICIYFNAFCSHSCCSTFFFKCFYKFL